MNRRLIFRPEAEVELSQAVDWYENRGKGLGAEFLRSVDGCIAVIQRNPHQYQTIHKQVRRAGLRRFPYSLIYLVTDREIIVLACFHGSRDPQHWMERA